MLLLGSGLLGLGAAARRRMKGSLVFPKHKIPEHNLAPGFFTSIDNPAQSPDSAGLFVKNATPVLRYVP
jgi:hypothetical protein